MEQKTPTPAGAIAAPDPFFNIELPVLKTKTGEPVVIRCGRPSAIDIARIVCQFDGKPNLHQNFETFAELLVLAAVEPRVTRDGAQGTINVAWLEAGDLLAIGEAFAELRGAGGPATTFPDGDGGGPGVRGGSGRDGGAVRKDAGGGAERSTLGDERNVLPRRTRSARA